MKPDWDDLGEKFENSKKVLIGDVDCTAPGNDKLCERFSIKGYPTLKVFRPPDRFGETYEGERDLASLKKFAKGLKPMCTVDTLSKCTEKERTELQPYLEMPKEEDIDKTMLDSVDARRGVPRAGAQRASLRQQVCMWFRVGQFHVKQPYSQPGSSSCTSLQSFLRSTPEAMRRK